MTDSAATDNARTNNAATDDAATLTLPRMISDACAGLARAGRRARIDQVQQMRLVVVGPSGAGKTELVHALLGGRIPHAAAVSAPGRTTARPVEFVASAHDGVALELGGGRGTTVPQFVAAHADLLDAPHTRRILVSSTARPLTDWNVRVVDTPGVDVRSGGIVELPVDVWTQATAVLYVVPTRGLTETDVRALEMLRAVPTVLVVNVFDTDVATSRSALAPVATPELAASTGVTVVARRLSAPGAERAALCSAVALLRGLGTPTATMLRIRDSAWFARHELDDAYIGELAAVTGARGTRDRRLAWEAAARLVRMERRGRDVVEVGTLLDGISSAAARTADIAALRGAVEDRARDLVDRYNVEGARHQAVRVTVPRTAPTVRPTPLDGVLAEHRAALREVIDAIVGEAALQLTDHDRRGILGIRDEVVQDRFEIAFVGQFSSGKSSLINALLGVPSDTPLLPTAPQPETATINHVVHDQRVSLKVEWVPRAELTLLEPADYLGLPGLAFRVHREELTALVDWLEQRIAHPRDCEFQLRSGRVCTPAEGAALLARMAAAIGIGGPRAREFVYLPVPGRPLAHQPRPLLPDADFPCAVEVKAFTGVPRVWRDDLGLPAQFDLVRAHPGLALRIEKLTIGYPHDLLRHVTLVDTPGTDAPIPRHRTASRAAIKGNRQRAVVYCFDGHQAASAEDKDNLAFLKECRIGTDELSRFFFVITRMGGRPRTEQDEISRRVAEQLAAQQITNAHLYITEVVTELNGEFHALARALGEFGSSTKLPLLAGRTRRVTEIVEQVRARNLRTLDGLAQDAATRAKRRVALEHEAAELGRIRAEFETSTAWGMPDVRRRTQPSNRPSVRDLDDDLGRASTRPEIEAIAGRLADDVEEINVEVTRLVRRTWDGCAGKLRSEVGSRLPGHVATPAELTLDGEVFPSSGLVEAASTMTWRGTWRRLTDFFGSEQRSWNQDIPQNRDRLTSAWRRSKQSAAAAVEGVLDGARTATLDDLDRLRAGIEQELAAATRKPSREAADAAQASLNSADVWLTRMHSLTRTIERAAT